MKINKQIIKTLVILSIIIISSLNVYANDLKYKAKFVNINNSTDYTCDIATPVQPSPDTISEYDNAVAAGQADSGGWLPGDNYIGWGSKSTFVSWRYVFAEHSKKFTSYNSGFDTRSNNTTNNNIYYDSYSGYIQDDFDSINDFSGVAANVPEDQDNYTSGYMAVNKDDTTYMSELKWKVVKPNNVVLNVYRLNNNLIQSLIEKFGESALSGTGIRFSNVLRTQFDRNWIFQTYGGNMDSSWLWFQGATGWWYSGVRGFTSDQIWRGNAYGDYKAGASVANEFDNILLIPVADKTKVKRSFYVRHIKEDGTPLPDNFANSYLNVTDSNNNVTGTLARINPKSVESDNPFQEFYKIEAGQGLQVRKSGTTEIGQYKYQFVRGEYAYDPLYNTAVWKLSNSKNTWSGDPHTFYTSTDNKDDVIVINLVYKEIPPPKQELPNLEMVGRLAFINTSTQYSGSTSSDTMDYIPATKTLTAYAKDAYPYVVRALKYVTNNETKSSSATVTANVKYTWDIWTYSHDSSAASRVLTCKLTEHKHISSCYDSKGVLTCKLTEHKHTDIWGACYGHQHTTACDWYHTTDYSNSNKVFNYVVSYKHTWYEITNFKMYRISKLEVYDDVNTNVGGTLFGGGTYTYNPSTTYENRFNNSSGRIQRSLVVSFPSKSYSIADVYVSLAKPTNDTSTASNTTQTSQIAAAKQASDNLALETNKTAADTTQLTISYDYDNDYVELDNTTNMLQRNERTWSEHIEKATDDYVRDLDATKTGSGNANTGDLNYTSNLMAFMRPSTRLTTNSDFEVKNQTVPANRENGVRLLSGKIYYNITSDSKYNVGTETFTSTDATYQLNKSIALTGLDFINYDKKYENNDVNKVNVLTPANYGNFELVTDEKVDHSTGAGDSTILQKNAVFTITPTTAGSTTAGYSLSDTREFIAGYYFIFDFNIIYNGALVKALTPIKMMGNNVTFTAKTTDSFGQGTADQITNSVKVVAITTNMTDKLKEYFDTKLTFSSTTMMDNDHNLVRNTTTQNQKDYLTRLDIVGDAYHVIYKRLITKNIGRIFDFAVTDCTDIAFKDIFKQSSTGNVNTPTGVAYYGGLKYWNLYSDSYNEMLNRTDIGSDPQKIIPLGPYKHTNKRYVNAPKMGYRISYDLKTTGYMNSNNATNSRKVTVHPSYYYISKDGKTFDRNIKLYFKNASGKYVDFASSGYTIYYKPNDGYRYLRNSAYTNDHSSMSTKLEPLTVSGTMELTNKAMSMNNTGFVQAWYGEFKLPNSTIAISTATGNVHNNVNNPYTDGYIGVKFELKCVDSGGFTIAYDASDKSASSQTNTSQWDYEGFMGFKTPGQQTQPLRYQLEKDMWVIDNARYQDVKGTVVLFDLDNRAANDFE